MLRRRLMAEEEEDYPEYVDLGLPSGKLWATGNITSDGDGGYKIGKPYEYGGYFSWANKVPHFCTDGTTFDDGYKFSWTTYSKTTGKNASFNINGNITYDAARALLGSPWYIPTLADVEELLSNTTYQNTKIKGVYGMKFYKSTNKENYIFFPFAGSGLDKGEMSSRYDSSTNNGWGWYWTSTYTSSTNAKVLLAMVTSNSPSIGTGDYVDRKYGIPIRAIRPAITS